MNELTKMKIRRRFLIILRWIIKLPAWILFWPVILVIDMDYNDTTLFLGGLLIEALWLAGIIALRVALFQGG